MAKKEKQENSVNNREFAVITYCFIGLFLCIMGYFAYFQTAKSEEFINNPYNTRQEKFAESVVRGKILSAEGDVLAETRTDAAGNEQRVYPYADVFAHIVGYDTKDHGRAGIESGENFNLLRSHAFILEQAMHKLTDQKNIGDDVVTTLQTSLQNAAYQALGEFDGAVAVLEPATGKILAMVSKPDFDPNTVSENWDEIVADEQEKSAFLNRASQGLYPPGSTFKILTALEYIREHPLDYAEYSYVCSGELEKDGGRLRCFGGGVHGEVDLEESFAKSCNTSFAHIGLSLKPKKFVDTCRDLLFNVSLPVEKIESSRSSFALQKEASSSEIMETAIGQGKTLVTPLHMLMIVSAVANGGELMKPYVVDFVQNYQGDIVQEHTPSGFGALMTQKEAGILKDYMKSAVEGGTASKLQGMSYQAYGKTGSAEFGVNKGDSHAWFVGFAHREDKADIAVAVILEGAGSGGAYAVPAAKRVLDAYYP